MILCSFQQKVIIDFLLVVISLSSQLFSIFAIFFPLKKMKLQYIAGRNFRITWIYRHTKASSAGSGPPPPTAKPFLALGGTCLILELCEKRAYIALVHGGMLN